MRQPLLFTGLLVTAQVLLTGGCADGRPGRAGRDEPTAGRRAANSKADFLPGRFDPDGADIARGPAAPMEVRRAVEGYYRERNWSTYHMPPPMRAVKTVGPYELLWVEAVKSLDRQLVYDRRSKRIVGTFSGYMPGGEYQSPATTPARAPTGP